MSNQKGSQWKHQKSWAVLSWIIVISLLVSGCAGTQQTKVYKVGVLAGVGAFAPAVDGFKAKMAELGYVEGKNISYDVQSTNVDIAAYKSTTKKFVDDKVDMIFVFATEAAIEAKVATQGTNIPVVFAMSFTDVEGFELIESVREPGGNITGVTIANATLASKRLEILLQLLPNAKKIFVPYLKNYPTVPNQLDAIHPQAASAGVELIEFAATSPEELQAKLDSFVSADGVGIDAIMQLAEPLSITPAFYSISGKFSYKHKVPIGGASMSIEGEYASLFGLLPDAKTAGQQAALLADKILKGTQAGTIPVITPENYFRINYKAAQALGVTIPEGLLKLADEVVR